MVKNSLTAGRSQAGFTLVELAIVMIIIGLLIGGILKGQELIGNAQVTSTVSQLKSIEAATTTFRDMYDAVPGDITNPAVRLPGCTAAPCTTAGNGNNRVDHAPGVAAAVDEGAVFWVHLNAADLVGGTDGTTTAAWGQGYPGAEVGGGFMMGFTLGGAAAALPGATGTNVRGGHYLSLQASPAAAANAAAGAGLTSSQAARIDRKMDDGQPGDGNVRNGGVAACVSGAAYDEAVDGLNCSVYVRVQQ